MSRLNLGDVLQRLHDSEINASVQSFFDGVWTVRLGDEMNGYKAEEVCDSANDAADWLDSMARRLFPQSRYVFEIA